MTVMNSVRPKQLSYAPLPALAKYNLVDDPDIADCRGKRIGILIVAYNAINTLAKVLRRIPPNVWNNVEEVAVFDDASQDSTYELALGMKASQSIDKLTVIGHGKNLGYGGNQKAGYKYFLEKGFDIVVMLHGDGQYAPEVLAHLYHPLVMGQSDAVFGSRMMKTYGGPLKGGMPLYKLVGNRVLTKYENALLGLNLTEFHSGYRAYSLGALKHVVMDNMTNNFHYDTEIIIKLHHQGFRITEVPIPTYYGDEVCHVDGMKYAADVAKSVARYKKTIRSVTSYPEFAEYYIKYPLKDTKYSSHYYSLQLTGANKDVLELGCGDGAFSKRLAAQGNRVTGIGASAEPKHQEAFEQYLRADMSYGLDADVRRKLEGKQFDRILLRDVLEHQVEPGQVLKDCRALLKDSGLIVVTTPNTANLTVRLSLLAGRFEMADRGLLDRTHLRFFTRRTARKLLNDAGYDIVAENSTVIPLELSLGIDPANVMMKILNGLMRVVTSCWATLFGYEFVFLCRPKA